MWSARGAAVALTFMLGVLVFGLAEAVLSHHANNCVPSEQQPTQQQSNQQGATAQQPHADDREQGGHQAKRERFVCTVAGVPTAIRDFMNHNEGFFVAGFTLMLVIVTGWLVKATIGLRDSTDRLWEAGERQMELIERNSKRQSDDMQESVRATQKSAQAAERSVEVAERTLQTIDRPWIAIDAVDFASALKIEDDGMHISITFTITNVGRSPATNVNIGLLGLYPSTVESGDAIGKFRQSMRYVMPGATTFGSTYFPGVPSREQFDLLCSLEDFVAARQKMVKYLQAEDEQAGKPRTAYEDYALRPTVLIGVSYFLPGGGRGSARYSIYQGEIWTDRKPYPGFVGDERGEFPGIVLNTTYGGLAT